MFFNIIVNFNNSFGRGKAVIPFTLYVLQVMYDKHELELKFSPYV